MFLSLTKTALKLGVSRPIICRMAVNGNLPVVRIGKRLKIDETKLYQWLERGGQNELEGEAKK